MTTDAETTEPGFCVHCAATPTEQFLAWLDALPVKGYEKRSRLSCRWCERDPCKTPEECARNLGLLMLACRFEDRRWKAQEADEPVDRSTKERA